MAERFLVPETVKLPEDVPMRENVNKKTIKGVPMPESLLKKAERTKEIAELKMAARANLSKIRKARRAALLARSLEYDREYNDAENGLVQAQKSAIQNGGLFREPEPKVIFAIRLKGINKLAPKPKKILQLFRLRQIHNGVFMRVNKATLEMLKVIHPFITFGYPSLKMIRELIYKRGYAKVGKAGAWSRKRILENDIVADNLGKYGIEGVEDIVHELITCGPHFKEVNNFLWPFKLSSPKGGWIAKRRGFCDPRGGDWGNRETFINKLVMTMN